MNESKLKAGILGSIILFSLIISLSLIPGASAQSQTEVSVTPSSQTVSPGESFTIEIVVDPATEIAGVQFDLYFDPSLVSVDTVQEGNLLDQNGANNTYFQIMGEKNNSTGELTGVAGAILESTSVTSSGTFAIINMTAKNAEGTSSLNLKNVKVTAPDGSFVPITVNDGSVEVSSSNEEDTNTQNSTSGGLIYNDFNDGTPGTNTGGAAGAMSPSGEDDPTIDFTTDSKEGAYALSIDYSFSSGGWVGYWSFFNADESGYDISSYDELRFWAKGATGDEQFKIELKSAEKETSIYYVSVPSTSYEEVIIPLSDFEGTGWPEYSPADLSSVKQVNLVFDRAPTNSTVYVDEIKFTSEGYTPSETPSNQAPQADIETTPSPATGVAPLQVYFDASNSSDSDGSITSYEWEFGDGYTGTGVTVTHTYSSERSYTANLTVTDNGQATDTTTVAVTVNSQEEEEGSEEETTPSESTSGGTPTAEIDLLDPNPAETGETIVFFGHGSDSDGEITGYLWKIDGKNVSTEETFEMKNLSSGVHEVSLKVRNDEGNWSESTTEVLGVNSSESSNSVPLIGIGIAIGAGALLGVIFGKGYIQKTVQATERKAQETETAYSDEIEEFSDEEIEY